MCTTPASSATSGWSSLRPHHPPQPHHLLLILPRLDLSSCLQVRAGSNKFILTQYIIIIIIPTTSTTALIIMILITISLPLRLRLILSTTSLPPPRPRPPIPPPSPSSSPSQSPSHLVYCPTQLICTWIFICCICCYIPSPPLPLHKVIISLPSASS